MTITILYPPQQNIGLHISAHVISTKKILQNLLLSFSKEIPVASKKITLSAQEFLNMFGLTFQIYIYIFEFLIKFSIDLGLS